ncbi:WD40 repeat domain-containing protein [Reichenbachiella sp.]|uniref:WD40 repeat domain-containing protein n=1 Tax=Reichenbachiella sp. TaxID=2184521 RepID=UPI003BAE6638
MKIVTSLLALLFLAHTTIAQSEAEKSLQNQLDSLNELVVSLETTELIQSMSQRSILTPRYFADRKSLTARQAYNFWIRNTASKFISHLNVYSALYNANKYYEYDSIENTFYNHILEHDEMVTSIVYSKEPNIFYSASSDGKILKWDESNIKKEPVLLYRDRVLYRSLDLSSDGQWLLAVTKENGVLLINTQTGQSQSSEVNTSQVSRDSENAQAAIFLPDQLNYLTVNRQGEIKIKGYELDSIKGKTTYEIRALAVDAEKSEIYAGTIKGVVQVWNERFENAYLDIPENFAVNVLAVSPDHKLLAIGREKGDAIIWHLEEKRIVRIISGHQSAITAIDFSPDTQRILTASRDGTVRVWDIFDSKKFPIVLDDHNDWVMTACFDQSGNKILTGSKDKTIRIFNLDFEWMADRLCQYISRNMTSEEWHDYVGHNFPYEDTCPNLLEKN